MNIWGSSVVYIDRENPPKGVKQLAEEKDVSKNRYILFIITQVYSYQLQSAALFYIILSVYYQLGLCEL